MESGRVAANGIELVYDAFGDPDATPLLLVMGLGVPRFGWEDDFCRMLAERGFRAVRFDNRDVGESTHLADAPVDLWAVYGGDASAAPYLLDDLADDAAGLLDALGIASAHVVGASMGGMIAQALAIRHPGRIRSLTSIMSTVSPSIGAPRQDVVPILLAPPGRTREEHEEIAVRTWRVIGSPGFPLHEDRIRELARRVWEVGHDPEGFKRQLAATIASGDRTGGLREVDVPALVIHGAADPLIQLPGGEATARAIPGAELEVIDGMGHDLPPELFAHFADRIAQLARRADGARVEAA